MYTKPNNIIGKLTEFFSIFYFWCLTYCSNHRLTCIPCQFMISTNKACFNVSIFYGLFHKHFVPEVQRYQEEELKLHPDNVRALLLLDDAPVHPTANKLVSDDGRIRVMYLPANTSLIQLMDQGIISACKRRYQ